MASILMQLGIDQYTDRFKTWIDKNYAKKGEGGGGLTYNDQDDKIYDGETAIELSADTTTTTREMTVSSAIGDYAAGAKIAEGTDVMTILANIFEKTLGISVTQPSASLTKSSGDEAGTYEYGTPIDAVLLASLNTGEYKGSGGTYPNGGATGISATSYTGENATADETTNSKGTVKIGALTATTTVKVTIAHSDGNMPQNNKGEDLSGSRISAGSKSATKIYTPVKYWWIGFSNDKYEDTTGDSDGVRALSLEKNIPVTTKTKSVTFPQGAKQQVIAVPSGTSFTAKDGSGNDITGTFSTSDAPVVRNVPVKCGGTTDVYYDVYVAPANAGLAANSKATITIA